MNPSMTSTTNTTRIAIIKYKVRGLADVCGLSVAGSGGIGGWEILSVGIGGIGGEE